MFTCVNFLGSMAEVASLTLELDALRGKKSPGTVMNLSFPYFPSLSNDLDKIDKEKKVRIRRHLL